MGSWELEVDNNPSPANNAVLREGIVSFNVSHLHERANHFSIFVRNEQKEIIGGATVWQHSDAMYIDILWFAEQYRRKSLGSRVIEELFKQARAKNINNIFVDTFDFQALDFYLKKGFVVIARLEKFLLGHDRIYLKKVFE
ncbi:N-acetylglutamate synthase [Legionella massiliensis]|uniref:N-acetylglutamate synthase n=1 Tax=Legionella massiliensis TaxID=1034943 RepID=A0A078KSX7_9GAMM|nr:GNAT family N-acetyltransferase [Legionella massiliensis]CDZ77535.1 N-acetylglutamate synthase [Legionella massiliensis]CEE13273.1 N-acetylglutamate synthase [Legionella massiliensis]